MSEMLRRWRSKSVLGSLWQLATIWLVALWTNTWAVPRVRSKRLELLRNCWPWVKCWFILWSASVLAGAEKSLWCWKLCQRPWCSKRATSEKVFCESKCAKACAIEMGLYRMPKGLSRVGNFSADKRKAIFCAKQDPKESTWS